MTDQGQTQQTDVQVPIEVMMQMKLLEFDKLITESEAQVAELKKQKVAFIYDSNLRAIQQKFQKQPDQKPEQPSA